MKSQIFPLDDFSNQMFIRKNNDQTLNGYLNLTINQSPSGYKLTVFKSTQLFLPLQTHFCILYLCTVMWDSFFAPVLLHCRSCTLQKENSQSKEVGGSGFQQLIPQHAPGIFPISHQSVRQSITDRREAPTSRSWP